MGEDELKYYMRAGEIAYNAKKFAEGVVKPGKTLLEVADSIEKYIIDSGGDLAFPINLSVNHVAAHRTPLIDDKEAIPEDSVIKVDLGVHINGFIADTALTLIFNDKYVRLGEVVQKALVKGLSQVKPGVKFSDAGRVIEKTVRKAGYKVIKNLTGHNLGQYRIHAGESIPNYRDPFARGRFKAGKAYAMEPFGTDGKGWVKEIHSLIQIYSLRKVPEDLDKLGPEKAKIVDYVTKKFRTLPFCERWLRPLIGELGINEVRGALQELSRGGVLYSYPVLVEVGKGFVVQFEETFVVGDDGPIITTNPVLREEIKTFKKH